MSSLLETLLLFCRGWLFFDLKQESFQMMPLCVRLIITVFSAEPGNYKMVLRGAAGDGVTPET